MTGTYAERVARCPVGRKSEAEEKSVGDARVTKAHTRSSRWDDTIQHDNKMKRSKKTFSG